MAYIICCDNYYVSYNAKTGGYRIVLEEESAYRWQDENKAINMCKQLQNSKFFNEYNLTVKKVDQHKSSQKSSKNGIIKMLVTENMDTKVYEKSTKPENVIQMLSGTEETVGSFDHVKEFISEQKKFSENVMVDYEAYMNRLENRKQELLKELSNVDLMISDLEHYAEFYKLNASDGYNLYKMIHNVTVRRREIKNEFEEINSMKNYLKSVKTFHDELHKNRKYRPRILKDLFKKGR